MKRRSFVKASLFTSLIPMIGVSAKNPTTQKKSSQEFYELRVYTLKNETQQKLVEDYFQNAAIPAFNRSGSKNIGVFTELKPTGFTKLYALIPFKSMDDFLSIQEKLTKDKVYNEAGTAYLTAPATEPAYDRIESSLLKAFTHMPKIEVPEKKSRIFELRRYESASESAGKKKVDMFNTLGEIEIFKRVGLTPVFFGETLIGGLRPNLTYMLTYDDMDERVKNWKIFGSDPEWKKISSMPDYADAKIVSHITSIFLAPTSFSQI
ncbi:MAG: NIPSNAP family protein [Chitinophagaceae bacterium]